MTVSPDRIRSADVVRGLFACGVLYCHYSYFWPDLVIPPIAQAIGHKLGVYAVEGFFALSGFSLYWAYHSRPPSTARSVAEFALSRMLRLIPLFAAIVWLNVYLHGRPDSTMLWTNLTLTFGFFNASQSLIVGGWSIAVEMVLSALFPALLLLAVRRQRDFLILTGLSIALLVAWPLMFGVSSPVYAQAPNHLMFFLAGILIGMARQHGRRVSASVFWLGIVACVALFVAIEPTIQHWSIVIQPVNRIIFAAITVAATALFCLYDFRAGLALRTLTYVGTISYSIYLLHPVMFGLSERFFPDVALNIRIAGCVAATFLGAAAAFALIEWPFMALARAVRRYTRPPKLTSLPI